MIDFMENNFNKETEDSIYFYTPKYFVLDNFSAHVVKVWGEVFQTSEHAYQWKKYCISQPDIAREILIATSPDQVKKISDSHKDVVDAGFHDKKVAIMEEILRAKFEQHEKVQRILKETGSKLVIENSPMDDFWGIGSEGNGQNMLGKLWMKIRDDNS